jgi:hypothetical protein
MSERRNVRVTLLAKDVFGSLLTEQYGDDKVIDVMAQLQALLEQVPIEYRDQCYIGTESEGGWEGEHHTTVEVYYERPETDAEMQERIAEEQRRQSEAAAQERALYENLKRKFG